MIHRHVILALTALVVCAVAAADEPAPANRCEVVPLPNHRASFRIDGREVVAWHFGTDYPRPFFYPFNGPSGSPLTRMGHPGAPDHDHHQSIWFAHHSVNGIDFWSNQSGARVRQKQWLCYEDGDQRATMASLLGWYDPEGRELMEQELIAAVLPMDDGEYALELGITFRTPANGESIELGKTNFGLLAVRVAKSLSDYFGNGRLTSSEGVTGEPMLFAKPARWMDYSGPVPVGMGTNRTTAVEGITFFDHPQNPRYPTAWHVREDGWMGASFCLNEPHVVSKDKPLVVRYLLHAHRGPYDQARAERAHRAFADRAAMVVRRSTKKHVQFEVSPLTSSDAGTDQ